MFEDSPMFHLKPLDKTLKKQVDIKKLIELSKLYLY